MQCGPLRLQPPRISSPLVTGTCLVFAPWPVSIHIISKLYSRRAPFLFFAGLLVFGRTKEVLNTPLSLGGFCARDPFRPSLVFGVIELVRGMYFLFQFVTLYVLHFPVTPVIQTETSDFRTVAPVSVPSYRWLRMFNKEHKAWKGHEECVCRKLAHGAKSNRVRIA